MSLRERLSRLVTRVLGSDEEAKIDAAMDARDELEDKVRHLKRAPDFRVEIFWSEEDGEFEGHLYTRDFPEPLEIEDVSGSTPGEVLSYAGMILDAALARRGFRKDKRSREAFARFRIRPKNT